MVEKIVDPITEIEEVAPEVIEEPVEETIEEPIEEPIEEVAPEIVLTEAQIDAGQTVEEALINPVEGAQIHNK